MGPGIVIPLVVVATVVPFGLVWAKRTLRGSGGDGDPGEPGTAPSARLTSTALRALPSPPWRVVYEIADDRLGGIGHVVIGPAGVFALRTTIDPLPDAATEPLDARAVADAAIRRGALDDALARCRLESDRLVVVHWGAAGAGPLSIERGARVTAVAGRALVEWLESRPTGVLSPSQVDLAWQTVVTAIGRPDPLG